jgi:hypothetical protein
MNTFAIPTPFSMNRLQGSRASTANESWAVPSRATCPDLVEGELD